MDNKIELKCITKYPFIAVAKLGKFFKDEIIQIEKKQGLKLLNDKANWKEIKTDIKKSKKRGK